MTLDSFRNSCDVFGKLALPLQILGLCNMFLPHMLLEEQVGWVGDLTTQRLAHTLAGLCKEEAGEKE